MSNLPAAARAWALVVAAGCAASADRTAEPPPGDRPVPAAAPATSQGRVDRPTPWADLHRDDAARIVDEVRRIPRGPALLEVLCDHYAARLSGSEALEHAVLWASATFEADGHVVREEKVRVPRWVRGAEGAEMTSPDRLELAMLGLGNSVGTPPGGIEAEVVVADDFDHLDRLGEAVRGKIVLFNRPMPPFDPSKGSGYGEAVVYRTKGASRAARLGAVAVLVRSVTARSLRTPHTGMLSYDADAPRIPAAALATEDADRVARRAAVRPVRVRLRMEARFEGDADSANVIAEIRGRERPGEIVLLAAHLDSWDVGQGAQDDGGGCVAVMDAMRAIRASGLVPRRTIRAVLFTNEENGLRGALDYALRHEDELKDHVAAIEADSGTYAPLGVTTPAARDERQALVRSRLEDVLTLLAPIGATRVRDGGGGADIGPLAPAGVPQIGLDVEGSRYFDVHHTHADTLDKVDPKDLEDCTAVLAVLAYVLADAPERLAGPAVAAPPPHEPPKSPEEPAAMKNLYDLTIPTLDGKPCVLSDFRGKAALVVNVASECGFTPQYEGLQKLHEELASRGFAVLGFPSNEFGAQEPGSAEEIRTFCTTRYAVTFPLFAKTEVRKGAGQSPAFAYLAGTTGHEPNWNFCKYVVDREGRVTHFFPSRTKPDDPKLREAIEAALGE